MLHEGTRKTVCFDLDGVICSGPKSDYEHAKPNPDVVALVNELHQAGVRIVIHTARFMGRSGDDAEVAESMGRELTERQLVEWGVRYDKLVLGKPSYDLVIDDKAAFFREDWSAVRDLSKQICGLADGASAP